MAAATTIIAAGVSIAGPAIKGIIAQQASTGASREAGRFRIQQEELQNSSIARLEQDYFEAVRVNTDAYDKALEMSNVKGAEMVQVAQEGNQRGVQATAGKVKEIEQAGLSDTADKFAETKLKVDLKRAESQEMSAAEIAALEDDRAAAAGVKADALAQQADDLSGEAVGSFIDAGVGVLKSSVTAFGGGGAKGKAARKAAREAPGYNALDDFSQKLESFSGVASGGKELDLSNFTPEQIAALKEAGYIS